MTLERLLQLIEARIAGAPRAADDPLDEAAIQWLASLSPADRIEAARGYLAASGPVIEPG